MNKKNKVIVKNVTWLFLVLMKHRKHTLSLGPWCVEKTCKALFYIFLRFRKDKK